MSWSAEEWIRHLQLQAHPEGGYYREIYRSAEKVAAGHLPPRFHGDRSFATSIYFMLCNEQFSALHRLHSDETWHFYAGASLIVHQIDAQGNHSATRLGGQPESGEVLQHTVPAGTWFGSSLVKPQGFALVGCTVAPGFDFADFELGARADLLRRFPQHREIIEKLTR